MNVFEGMALHYGVLYPMQTFTKNNPVDFNDIPCFVEGNDDMAFETAYNLASNISSHVYPLDSTARKNLHLAAVFACHGEGIVCNGVCEAVQFFFADVSAFSVGRYGACFEQPAPQASGK